MFAVRLEKNARQTISLSCVEGKRTTNNFFAGCFFALRYGGDARQRSSLPCARKKTHGKDFHVRQRFSRTANSGFPVMYVVQEPNTRGRLAGGGR
jgi:hypothetical protein